LPNELILNPAFFRQTACALAVGAEIWGQDRHFKGNRIKNWTTKELLEMMMK